MGSAGVFLVFSASIRVDLVHTLVQCSFSIPALMCSMCHPFASSNSMQTTPIQHGFFAVRSQTSLNRHGSVTHHPCEVLRQCLSWHHHHHQEVYTTVPLDGPIVWTRLATLSNHWFSSLVWEWVVWLRTQVFSKDCSHSLAGGYSQYTSQSYRRRSAFEMWDVL